MREKIVYKQEVKYEIEGKIENIVMKKIKGRGMKINVERDVDKKKQVELKLKKGIEKEWIELGQVKWKEWQRIKQVEFVYYDKKIDKKGKKIKSLKI